MERRTRDAIEEACKKGLNGVDLIKDDHRKLDSLFSRYKNEATDNINEKIHLAGEIVKELTIHSAVEEELLYPVFKKVNATKAYTLIDETELTMRPLCKEIFDRFVHFPFDRRQELNMGELDSLMSRLEQEVNKHVEEEEREVLDPLRIVMQREQLDDMRDLIIQLKFNFAKLPLHPEKSYLDQGGVDVKRFLNSVAPHPLAGATSV